jgi:SprT protein
MIKTQTENSIEPINHRQQYQVRTSTDDAIVRAGDLFDRKFPLIPVHFDLKGRAAGMYKVHNDDRVIRYNPYIFAKYFDDNLATTVPHEVAHYVVDRLFGAARVRPHGNEWKQVMLALGAEPCVTGHYDLSGIPVRKQKRHRYQCDCAVHQISSARHNKILQGSAHYFCRKCKSPIEPASG